MFHKYRKFTLNIVLIRQTEHITKAPPIYTQPPPISTIVIRFCKSNLFSETLVLSILIKVDIIFIEWGLKYNDWMSHTNLRARRLR